MVFTDQQSRWSVSAYGSDEIKTPNIDSLAGEGAVFKNYFTVHAMCTAARGSFLTGNYPHAHGAVFNQDPVDRSAVTLAALLQRQGYETGYAGKWHLAGRRWPGWVAEEDSMGFQDSRFMFNGGHFKKIESNLQGDPFVTIPPARSKELASLSEAEAGSVRVDQQWIGDENSYPTDWLTDRAIEFIEKERDAPFFFMLSIPDPHPPYVARQPYARMFDPDRIRLPHTFYEDDVNKPAWARTTPGALPDDAAMKKMRSQYYAQVKCIDDNLGRLLAVLEETGKADNTIVVFTTDHGDLLGEHGLTGKAVPYESAYHIPLLMRWRNRISPGTVVSEVFSIVDLLPTLGSLMGFDSGTVQGRDGSSLLFGTAADWEDASFMHFNARSENKYRSHLGVWTDEHMLAFVRNSDPVLFDRHEDPLQETNIFWEPSSAKTVESLTNRLLEHLYAVKDPDAEWLHEQLRSPVLDRFSFDLPETAVPQ